MGIQVKALHHVALNLTDLAEAERFGIDFGLHTVSNNGDTLYMRTSGGDAFSFVVSRAGKRGLHGLGFLADSVTDLEEMIERHDATPIRELESPGGGLCVSVTHPEGFNIDIMTDVESGAGTQGPQPLQLNIPDDIARTGVAQSSRPLGPAHLYSLGHTGLYTRDCGASLSWFQDVLGLVLSDTMYFPDNPDRTMVAFLRVDQGNEWVDHHCVFLIQDERSDCHHLSFESIDYQAQCVAHRWMKKQGWELNWGIGRHPQGSHVFDVWFGPERYRFETYSDTDKLNNTHKPGRYNIYETELDIWRDQTPESYFK